MWWCIIENRLFLSQGIRVFFWFFFPQIPREDAAALSLVSCFCWEAAFSEDARQGLGFGGSRERRGGHLVGRCRRRGRYGFRSRRGGSRAPASRGGSQNPRRQSVGIPREGAWLLHLASCWPEPWKEASWFQQRPYYTRRRSRWVKELRVFFVSLFLLLLQMPSNGGSNYFRTLAGSIRGYLSVQSRWRRKSHCGGEGGRREMDIGDTVSEGQACRC